MVSPTEDVRRERRPPPPAVIPTATNASTHFPVSYVRLEIGDEVSDADREAATLGIKAMRDYADSLGVLDSDVEGEISFYVYQNFDELERVDITRWRHPCAVRKPLDSRFRGNDGVEIGNGRQNSAALAR